MPIKSYSADEVSKSRNSVSNEEMLGEICAFIAKSNSPQYWRDFGVIGHINRLLMPIMLGQAEVLRNNFNQMIGFVTWANITDDVERRLIYSKRIVLYDFEWNEGDNAWIVDCEFRVGSLNPVLLHLRDHTFANFKNITYMRRHADENVFKSQSRDATSSFWRRERRSSL